MKTQQFRDTRTGEIVTQVPLMEIRHFAEYEQAMMARNIAARDKYLSECFPDRKASDTLGFYTLVDGSGLGVHHLNVTHYPEDSECLNYDRLGLDK